MDNNFNIEPLLTRPCAASGDFKNVKRFRDGLVFKAHRLLYHSTLGLRVMKREREVPTPLPSGFRVRDSRFSVHLSGFGVPREFGDCKTQARPDRAKGYGQLSLSRLLNLCPAPIRKVSKIEEIIILAGVGTT